jgi:hypothetical protein
VLKNDKKKNGCWIYTRSPPSTMAELWTFDTHIISKGTAHNGSLVELCGGDHGVVDFIPEETYVQIIYLLHD